jgi:hypothetical protein
MFPPSLLIVSEGWGLIDLPLRASTTRGVLDRAFREQEDDQASLQNIYSFTVIVIVIGTRGLSQSSRGAATILSTTSMPRNTSPKTV